MPVVRTLEQFRSLPARLVNEWRGAFTALDRMRDRGESLTAAARHAGLSPATVRSYVQPALERRGGKWVARPSDRLLRVMEVLSEDGFHHEVAIRGSRTASLLGSYWSAVGAYLDGNVEALDGFRGVCVAGLTLETDPDAIEMWERRGELRVDDIYSLTS